MCVLVACGQSQQEASLRVITHATDTRGLPYERSRDACRLRNATTFSYQSILLGCTRRINNYEAFIFILICELDFRRELSSPVY